MADFWDHLDVLRGAVLRSLAAVLIMSCVGLVFKTFLFDTIILAPTKSDFIVYKFLGWDFDMSIINIEVSAQFFIHLRAALSAGLVLAFPYIIWEIWRFVTPALYEHEKKPFRTAFLLASFLFYVGVAVGYFMVLPLCVQFFMNYSVSSDIMNSISLRSYMSTFTSTVLLVGIAFEFPTVIMVLNKLGIITRNILKKGRKYAVMIILILSAILTPADPVSMIVVAMPLYLLYEITILLCSSRKIPGDTALTA